MFQMMKGRVRVKRMGAWILCIVILAFLLFSFLCLSGCKTTSVSPAEKVIKIYELDRDVFLNFLEEPSVEKLDQCYVNEYALKEEKQWHLRTDGNRIPLEKALFDFVCDESKIAKYLSENDMCAEVKSAFVLDTPFVPLSIWVKTSQESVFIKVDIAKEAVAYDLFLLSDYRVLYSPVQSEIYVNGNKTEKQGWIYAGYADIPVLGVLKALGAKTDEKDACVDISFKGKKYVLDKANISICRKEYSEENLLHVDGGTLAITYLLENDVMIDSYTVRNLLYYMGCSVDITCDKLNKIVLINSEMGS